MLLQFVDYDKYAVPTYLTEAFRNCLSAHYTGYVIPHMQASAVNALRDITNVKRTHIHDFYLVTALDQSAYVIAETSNLLLLVAVDKQQRVNFGFVMPKSWQTLYDDLYKANKHKEAWYESRSLHLADKVEKLADVAYSRMCKRHKKEALLVLKELYNFFGDLAIKDSDFSSKALKTKKQLKETIYGKKPESSTK